MTVIPNTNPGVSLIMFAWRGDRIEHQRVAIVGWRIDDNPDLDSPAPEVAEEPILADYGVTFAMREAYKDRKVFGPRSVGVIETLHPSGNEYRALHNGRNLYSFTVAKAFAGFELARDCDEAERWLAVYHRIEREARERGAFQS